MAFGTNPILSPKKTDGKLLDITKIFFTFQGEGVFTGFPAVFVRLSGCNLACKFCDTDFNFCSSMSIEEILTEVKRLSVSNVDNLVVVTGGEPLRQNIQPLCQLLIENKFKVQIETNGTLFQDLPKEVTIVCSPKNNINHYQPIRPDLLAKISYFKFLISANNANYNLVPDVGQNDYKTPVYLQPIDEYDPIKNKQNKDLTLKLASKYGYRISLQTHKFWDID